MRSTRTSQLSAKTMAPYPTRIQIVVVHCVLGDPQWVYTSRPLPGNNHLPNSFYQHTFRAQHFQWQKVPAIIHIRERQPECHCCRLMGHSFRRQQQGESLLVAPIRHWSKPLLALSTMWQLLLCTGSACPARPKDRVPSTSPSIGLYGKELSW